MRINRLPVAEKLLVSTPELASLIGVSVPTIGVWTKRGLPCVQVGPRRRLFDVPTVKAWLTEYGETLGARDDKTWTATAGKRGAK